ncbi:MAG: S41 family peptidase, partial [Elusimicrobiaceae bacterium]
MKKHIILSALIVAVFAVMAKAKPTTVSSLYRDDLVVVYELPDDADKAAAVNYITGVRDAVYKKAEIIDAKTAAPEVLKTKLAKGFVLYSVFGENSPLLNAAAKPLYLTKTNSKLYFLGKSFPGKDFSLIFVGKNPYSGEPITVYAAESNKIIDKINNLNHGSASYHLFKSGQPVSTGGYDYSFLNESIPTAKAIEDIDRFFTTLQEVHPDLIANISFEDYLRLKDWTVNETIKKSVNEAINREDFAYILYYAAASFRDGHTAVQWFVSPPNSPKREFPPFLVQFRNNKFFVLSALDKELEGMEIVSINGVPFNAFINPVLDRCSGELLAFKAARFTNRQGFWWWLSKLFSETDKFETVFLDKNGRQVKKSLRTVDFTEFDKLSDTASDMSEAKTSYMLYENGKIAHFVYPSFTYTPEEIKAVSNIFHEVRNAKALMIDIRSNGGGNSNMGELIMKHITHKPFHTFSQVQEKISRIRLENDDNLKRYSVSLAGLLRTGYSTETSYDAPADFFGGKVYLMTDNGTFSSAADFATMFRDYECGDIIGYETGGLPICFGDTLTIQLKNSAIPFTVSFKKFYGPRPKE